MAAAAARPLFQLPFACGERWRLSTYPGHDDYDVDMLNAAGETNNRPIIASYGGTVISAGWDTGGGNYVRLDHGNGWNTLYLHMIRRPVVGVGDQVKQGQLLGRVGSTGKSSGPHLHYEQNLNRTKVEAWFNGKPSGITDDATSTPRVVESFNCGTSTPEPEKPTAGSVTGDSYTDLVATKADGTMWLYSNNFVRDNGIPYGDNRQIGHGWSDFTRLIPADATGDGYTDLLGVKADGTMWLYSNNFVRDNGIPYGDYRQIGKGWGAFANIIAADATGDGYTDLLGVKADGTMWLYSNNFVRDKGIPYGDIRDIGHGWGGFNRIMAG